MMSLSMCSDVSGHAESEHSFFFKDRTPQSHHDRDGGGVCGGFVTTPLQVCGVGGSSSVFGRNAD